VSPEVVDLGARARSGTVTVRNTGATALRWQASSSAGWLATAPSSGSVAPGGSGQVLLSADRTGLPRRAAPSHGRPGRGSRAAAGGRGGRGRASPQHPRQRLADQYPDPFAVWRHHGDGDGHDLGRIRVVATDERGNAGDVAGTVRVDACLIVG
jgi:hypothetical protein